MCRSFFFSFFFEKKKWQNYCDALTQALNLSQFYKIYMIQSLLYSNIYINLHDIYCGLNYYSITYIFFSRHKNLFFFSLPRSLYVCVYNNNNTHFKYTRDLIFCFSSYTTTTTTKETKKKT